MPHPTEQIQQQLQQLVSDLNDARLQGLTDARLERLSRDAKELQRLVRQA